MVLNDTQEAVPDAIRAFAHEKVRPSERGVQTRQRASFASLWLDRRIQLSTCMPGKGGLG